MGFSLFFSWYRLRLGCGSWFRQLIIGLFLAQFVYVQTAQAFAPVVIGGRIILTRVLGNVVARRAIASVAANEALIGLRTMQTYRALGTVAANDARFVLGATSTLRHAKDISWVSLALSSGAITLNDLNVTGNDKLNILFEPTAVKLTDGRYAIQVDGETKIVNANNLSTNSPIIYTYSTKTSKQIDDSEVFISDSLSDDYKYYGELRNGSYAQANDIVKLAEYLAQELYSVGNQEKQSEIEIDGKKYNYLYSKSTVVNQYLRHSEIGSSISATVRQTFENYRLKIGFDVEIIGITAEGKRISSVNLPSFPQDYDVDSYDRSVPYIHFNVNEDFVGDFPVAPQEQQLGSIEDIDSGLYSTKPLTAQQLATLYNALLMSAASQPDYEGIPFSSANPITASEVASSLAELGLQNPTYADLFEKAGVGNQITFEVVPNTTPSISPNPNPNHKEEMEEPISTSELEYPELEPPTARQILEPFNQFFPQLSQLTLSDKSVQCPTWQANIDFMNAKINIDQHCRFIEENQSTISTLMTLIWSVLALRYLLSA